MQNVTGGSVVTEVSLYGALHVQAQSAKALMISRKPFLSQQPFILLWAPNGNNAKLQLRNLHFPGVFNIFSWERDLLHKTSTAHGRSTVTVHCPGNADFA